MITLGDAKHTCYKVHGDAGYFIIGLEEDNNPTQLLRYLRTSFSYRSVPKPASDRDIAQLLSWKEGETMHDVLDTGRVEPPDAASVGSYFPGARGRTCTPFLTQLSLLTSPHWA